MEFCLIQAPFGEAGNIKGAEFGPPEIVKKINLQPFPKINSIDITGICSRNKLSNVIAFNRLLKEQVIAVLSEGYFPITIGGDHSISLGTISGVAEYYRDSKFGVIYIDAHGDMNTFENSPSGNIHGMTLAASMGVGEDSLTCLATRILSPTNLLLVGTRSLDKGEIDLINNLNIRYITSEEIRLNNIYTIIDKISYFIEKEGLEKIHLSIDIDVLDPSYAPGTGVPEPNGISPESLVKLIEGIIETGLVVSVDLVEFNPLIDDLSKTLDICGSIVDSIINNLRYNYA